MRGDRPGDEDLGAEPPRLLERAARQLVAGHARGEAEVVLDPGRGAGLAARRLALDHDRAQALGGAVHGGREPRGPGADDHGVVLRAAGSVPRPEQLGDARASADGPPSCRRRGGSRQVTVAGSGPPHSSAASGASGVSHLKVIWLRSRKCRSSRAGRVPAVPDNDRARRRRVGRDALQPARTAHPVSRQPADLDGRRRARRRRPRGSRVGSTRMTRDRSAARNPTGNTVPRTIGTSPKTSPGGAHRRRARRRRRA